MSEPIWREFFVTTGAEKRIGETIDNFVTWLFELMEVEPNSEEEKIVKQLAKKHVPEVIEQSIAMYAKHFTEEEAKGMLLFYRTTVGKKLLEKMPILMLEQATLSEKLMSNFGEEAKELIAKSRKNKYTFFWRDGKREVLEGADQSEALNKAGYALGAVPALDFVAKGDNHDYVFNARVGWVKDLQKVHVDLKPN